MQVNNWYFILKMSEAQKGFGIVQKDYYYLNFFYGEILFEGTFENCIEMKKSVIHKYTNQ